MCLVLRRPAGVDLLLSDIFGELTYVVVELGFVHGFVREVVGMCGQLSRNELPLSHFIAERKEGLLCVPKPKESVLRGLTHAQEGTVR